MIEAYKKFWRHYFNFSDRSSRSDFWWVILCNVIIIGVISCPVDFVAPVVARILTIVVALYELAVAIPELALIIRRIHDTNRSGWYFFMLFIPIIGVGFYLYYMLSNTVDENNPYKKAE